jgi:glyoxylase-like metal-dependent hydrolase (beta-lactamase superfamily II)
LPGLHLVASGQFALSHACDCHVYLADCGGALCLIDAGVGLDNERVLRNIRAAGYEPSDIGHILVTHAHSDHAGGCQGLAEATGAQVVCSEPEAKLMAEGTDEELGLILAKHSGCYPQDYVYPHYPPDGLVSDRETLRIGKVEVTCLVLPGHSVASACYLFDGLGGRCVLFSGDTVLFRGLIAMLNCPGSDINAYRESIFRLAEVEFDALMPGHLVFVCEGGMEHVRMAKEALSGVFMPRCMGQA